MPSTASFWDIINNVYDAASAALRLNLSYDHTHSSGSGSGGQLDWDVIWSDAVHSHGTNTEGGQLTWSTVWTDAAHNHSAAAGGGILDHGQALSSASLADDDHPQYVQENVLTTLGDIPYASGSATWTRLAIGSANTSLQVNSAGTGYSFVASVAKVTSGSYTGDATANKAIAHSLGVTPKFVTVQENQATMFSQIMDGTAKLYFRSAASDGSHAVTAMDGTSFYVGNATSYTQSCNGSGLSYRWVSMG